MRRILRLLALGTCCLLLSGCEGVLYFQLFNFTGQEITVIQSDRKLIRIPVSESRQFRYEGSSHDGQKGLLVQDGHRQWFYAARASYLAAIGNGGIFPTIPAQYDTQIGPLGYGRRIGVDSNGNLYLVANGTIDLAANLSTQPQGFPIKPR